MNTVLTRSQKVFIALLCLIIHACMLVTFVGIKSQEYADTTPIIIVESDREHENVVEMLSGQAQDATSTPAIAQTPTPAPQQAPIPPAPAPKSQQAPLVAMNGFGSPATPAPQKASPAPMPEPIIPPQSAQESAQEPLQAVHASESEPIDEALFDETVALATQFLALEKAPAKKAEKKLDPAPLKTFTKQEPITHSDPIEKKKITLAHITNRVLEQMAQEQSVENEQNGGSAGAAMMVKSNRTGAASMQQIMFVNYCKKILSCIVTSYRIHKHNAPRCEQSRTACIKLVITSDGTIHALSLMQSSGNPALDHFILALFNDASSSFPPLPSALTAPLELPIFNISALGQLQSAEHWFIQ